MEGKKRSEIMKKQMFVWLLGLEGVLCLLLYFIRDALPGAFTAAVAFPFEQIGIGLRVLSLSGAVGNGIALALYVGICLLPLLAMAVLVKRRGWCVEDVLLGLASGVLFVMLYFMVNPWLLAEHSGSMFGDAGLKIWKGVLGGIFYSVLVGYGVLRLLRYLRGMEGRGADMGHLLRIFKVLLGAASVLFVYGAFGGCFGGFMDSLEAFREGNSGIGQQMGINVLFLSLQYGVGMLPYLMNVVVALAGLRLLRELQAGRYSEGVVMAAGKLSRASSFAVGVSVAANVGFNLLQLVFMKKLLVMNASVQFPVLPLTFALAALLLAQYVRENKELKDDNDSFI